MNAARNMAVVVVVRTEHGTEVVWSTDGVRPMVLGAL